MREEFTYTAMGRIASKTVKVIRLVSGVEKTAHLTAQHAYNNWGAVSQTTYPTNYTGGGSTVPGYIYNYSYDTMGRPSGTTYQTSGAGSPQTLVDSVLYNTAGQLTQMRWFNLSGGGSQTETRQYNSLGQMTRLTIPGQLDREYRFSASANDGKATSQKDYISGEEVEYQYDSLGRLSSAETTGAGGWGMSFVYDGWGNRLQQNAIKGTVPTQSILVDPATNRIQSHTYDANGNTVNAPTQGAMNFDVMDRLKTVASDTYSYSPANQRQWKNNDFTLWGAGGERLVTAQVYVIGNDLRFVQSGFDSYSHGRRLQVTDRLGSVGNYYPYGEAKSGAVSNADSFATYYRDSTALDYAQQRYYQPGSGRFLTTDPAQSSADSTAPESWHRYSYANNDAINAKDSQGLASEPVTYCYPLFVPGASHFCVTSITSSAGVIYSGFAIGGSPDLEASRLLSAARASLAGGWELTLERLRDTLSDLGDRIKNDNLTAGCADFLNDTFGRQYWSTLNPAAGPFGQNVLQSVSNILSSITFENGFDSEYAADFQRPGYYVRAFNPGGTTIYWRPGEVGVGLPGTWLLANILHEILHNWVPLDVPIQRAFKIAEDKDDTDNITQALQRMCFK
jgi:RHS repeat-associated protein